MLDRKGNKKTQAQTIEDALKANPRTVKIKALEPAKKMKAGESYWVSEDFALKFVEIGWAEIIDKDYEAKLTKKGEKLPKPKRVTKKKSETEKETE